MPAEIRQNISVETKGRDSGLLGLLSRIESQTTSNTKALKEFQQALGALGKRLVDPKTFQDLQKLREQIDANNRSLKTQQDVLKAQLATAEQLRRISDAKAKSTVQETAALREQLRIQQQQSTLVRNAGVGSRRIIGNALSGTNAPPLLGGDLSGGSTAAALSERSRNEIGRGSGSGGNGSLLGGFLAGEEARGGGGTRGGGAESRPNFFSKQEFTNLAKDIAKSAATGAVAAVTYSVGRGLSGGGEAIERNYSTEMVRRRVQRTPGGPTDAQANAYRDLAYTLSRAGLDPNTARQMMASQADAMGLAGGVRGQSSIISQLALTGQRLGISPTELQTGYNQSFVRLGMQNTMTPTMLGRYGTSIASAGGFRGRENEAIQGLESLSNQAASRNLNFGTTNVNTLGALQASLGATGISALSGAGGAQMIAGMSSAVSGGGNDAAMMGAANEWAKANGKPRLTFAEWREEKALGMSSPYVSGAIDIINGRFSQQFQGNGKAASAQRRLMMQQVTGMNIPESQAYDASRKTAAGAGQSFLSGLIPGTGAYEKANQGLTAEGEEDATTIEKQAQKAANYASILEKLTNSLIPAHIGAMQLQGQVASNLTNIFDGLSDSTKQTLGYAGAIGGGIGLGGVINGVLGHGLGGLFGRGVRGGGAAGRAAGAAGSGGGGVVAGAENAAAGAGRALSGLVDVHGVPISSVLGDASRVLGGIETPAVAPTGINKFLHQMSRTPAGDFAYDMSKNFGNLVGDFKTTGGFKGALGDIGTASKGMMGVAGKAMPYIQGLLGGIDVYNYATGTDPLGGVANMMMSGTGQQRMGLLGGLGDLFIKAQNPMWAGQQLRQNLPGFTKGLTSKLAANPAGALEGISNWSGASLAMNTIGAPGSMLGAFGSNSPSEELFKQLDKLADSTGKAVAERVSYVKLNVNGMTQIAQGISRIGPDLRGMSSGIGQTIGEALSRLSAFFTNIISKIPGASAVTDAISSVSATGGNVLSSISNFAGGIVGGTSGGGTTGAVMATSGTDLTVDQFDPGHPTSGSTYHGNTYNDLGLTGIEPGSAEWFSSVCGPIVIQAMLKAAGRDVSLKDVVKKAREDKTYDPSVGMQGGGLDKLGADMGLSLTSVSQSGAMEALKAGQAVAINAHNSAGGHFMLGQGVDANGRIFVGNSGEAIGIGQWATPEQMMGWGGGTGGSLKFWTASNTVGGSSSGGPSAFKNKKVTTADTGKDIGAMITSAAAANGLNPQQLLGMMISESGLNEHSERRKAWPDVSFGLTQMTVQTAGGYGIGDGSNTKENIDLVQSKLWDAETSINLGARALKGAKSAATSPGGPGGGILDALMVYNFGQAGEKKNRGGAEWNAHKAHYAEGQDLAATYHSGTRNAREGIAKLQEGEVVLSRNEAQNAQNAATRGSNGSGYTFTFAPIPIPIRFEFPDGRTATAMAIPEIKDPFRGLMTEPLY